MRIAGENMTQTEYLKQIDAVIARGKYKDDW